MTWLRFLVAILGLGALAYIVHWDARHPSISFLPAFLAAQLPSAAALTITAWRGHSIAGGSVPYWVMLRGNALALMGSLFVPARLSELGKPFYFKVISGYPRKKGLTLIIEERVWDMVIVALMCILGLLLAGEQTGIDSLLAAAWILSGMALCGLILLIAVPRLTHRLPLPVRIKDGLGTLRKLGGAQVLLHLLQSAAIWTASFGILICVYRLSGMPELAVVNLFFLFVVSTLGLVVSVTPGGLGVFEGSIVAVLAGFGVGWEDGLAFALGFRFCWMLLPIIAGLTAIWIDGHRLTERRNKEDMGKG